METLTVNPPAFMEILLVFMVRGRGVGVTDTCLKDDTIFSIVEPVCAHIPNSKTCVYVNDKFHEAQSMKLTTCLRSLLNYSEHTHMHGNTCLRTHACTDKQTDRQTDRQTDEQTETERQTDTHTHNSNKTTQPSSFNIRTLVPYVHMQKMLVVPHSVA